MAPLPGNENANQKPPVAPEVKADCGAKEKIKITPEITLDRARIRIYPNPAPTKDKELYVCKVTLELKKTPEQAALDLTNLTATFTIPGEVECFSDQDLTTKFDTGKEIKYDDFPKTLYLKGITAKDKCAVSLKGTTNPDPTNITFDPEVKKELDVVTPVKITPVIDPECKVVLVKNANPVNTKVSSACKVKIKFDINPAPTTDPTGLDAKFTFTSGAGKLECFANANCTTTVNDDQQFTYADLKAGKDLYVRGTTTGKATLKLDPVKPGNLDKVLYDVEDAATVDIEVVKVTLKVFQYAEARLYASQPGDLTTPVPDANKPDPGRQLHYQNTAKNFKLAKIEIDPGNLFTKDPNASIVFEKEPAANVTLRVYKNADGTSEVTTALQQANLQTQVDKTFYAKATATGNTLNIETEAGLPPGPRALRNPTKEELDCFIHLGAKVKTTDGKGDVEFKYADGTKIKTFSFDRYLDWETSNACSNRIQSIAAATLNTQDVAIAVAGLHCSLGPLINQDAGRVFVNKNTFWKQFKGGITASKQQGLQKIKTQLQNAGFILDPIMEDMIDYYLRYHYDVNSTTMNNMPAHVWGVPGAHAEVLAVNSALKYLRAKGQLAGIMTATQPVVSQISVATYKLQRRGAKATRDARNYGKRFEACPNCSGILNQTGRWPGTGLRIITG